MILQSTGEKPLEWPSMTAPMDQQSSVDKVPWGRWRLVENFRALQSGRLARRNGLRRFGHWTSHANCDLWDQHGTRQTITTLYLHQRAERGALGNRLFAGAGPDLWMARADGGWRHVGTGRSGGGQWSLAGMRNLVMAGNGRSILWQRLGVGTFGEVETLTDIGVTGAGCCWVYQGCFFVGDVVMDGVRVPHRALWGNIDSVDFSQGEDSIAGLNDLNPGEQILFAVPCGGACLIGTTHGFWRLGVSNDGTFLFQQLYYNRNRDACPISRNAWACNRDFVFFFATDGIYAISPFSSSPEWVEWINKGTPTSFLTTDQCVLSASEYDPDRHELLFSSASLGRTFVVNTREQSTSFINQGYNAICAGAIDRTDDLASWLSRSGVCDSTGLATIFPTGTRDDARALPAAERTATRCDLFSALCNPPCDTGQSLMVVTAEDNAVKIADDSFYGREMRALDGTVTSVGYGSRLVTPCMNLGLTEAKRVTYLLLDFIAAVTDVPAKITLTVGLSANPVEPTDATLCNVKRVVMSERELRCVAAAAGSSPNQKALRWTFFLESRFVWFDLQITPQVGGPVTFSRMVAGMSRSANAIQ